MTKLYHYITKGNNALKQGILSFANNPQADLHYYYKRTGGETTHSGIVKWMENCFEAAAAPFAVFRADTVDREKHKYVQTFYCER